MSSEYAERRIKEALKQANGNATRARQQVIAWTYEDAKLLHALTAPHLTGIVAYNIERILSGRSDTKRDQPMPKKPKVEIDNDFGIEILKAVAASDAVRFGEESYAARAKRGKASRQHIDAIRQMASRSKSPPPKK
jgi:hypothetical protein